MSKIFRFMSFQSFVDTILRKKLTFIHPNLWQDPYEFNPLIDHIKYKLKNFSDKQEQLDSLLEYIITRKIYCQSWTELNESDALWRVYSHNNTSIRISVEKSKINLLNDVKKIKVKYIDDFNKVEFNDPNIYTFLKTKRKAFSHEREIRLVTHYKFSSADDAKNKLKDLLTLLGKNEKFLQDTSLDQINNKVDELNKRLNYNLKQDTKMINYDHIDNFIESVMLNPFAPSWFEKTMEILCNKHNIKYLGKSQLYKE
ncbi:MULTISPECIES: hypothetical protein [Halanaerobium]|uniref:hypothetical protein n=1 Tax=Halanaerobium TaxID=2330 RepID=UPI00088BC7EA|nr:MULTISPECIES: hypothetical protein [Halanaerobium]RCW88437.1 hypothetical protein DER71_10484 [Halanaerobium sp. DL-01]SDH17021.1 hypothetical protein SAMN04515651_10758 [Halanaerobium congolense]